jgi:hypothetical protein
MKRFLILFLFLTLALSGCSSRNPCDHPQDTSCTRVLFIGNSYTSVNDLPEVFAELARAGHHPALVASSAPGGWTLAEHARSADTLRLLKSEKWNYVVLQEQSEVPSVQQWRAQVMYPAMRTLVQTIRDQGASPVFFLTWAHRGGLPGNGMFDDQSMQAELNIGYEQIAQELSVSVAPVGPAWTLTLKQYPDLLLWQDDGSHPRKEGTYLAACVFYAVLFQESPVDLQYRAGLSKTIAARLQEAAAKTVLHQP